jgi:hypothetical protein
MLKKVASAGFLALRVRDDRFAAGTLGTIQ